MCIINSGSRGKAFDGIQRSYAQDLTNSGLGITTAEIKAQSTILPKIEKESENIDLKRLKWMRNPRNNPVHKKIMHTRDKPKHDKPVLKKEFFF